MEVQPEHFTEKPIVSLQVLYYPKAIKNENTIPRVGFIANGYTTGIADLTLLPTQDGACEYREHVFHIGDPKLYDGHGNLSKGAGMRGCWEFSPLSELVMKMNAKKTAKA